MLEAGSGDRIVNRRVARRRRRPTAGVPVMRRLLEWIAVAVGALISAATALWLLMR